MKSVITKITSQDREIESAMSAYVDNIFINVSIVSAAHMRQHFADYGLVCKDPEWLRDGAKVLGAQVWERMTPSDWNKGVKFQKSLI